MTIRRRRTIIEVARRGRDGLSGRSTALVSATAPAENVGSGDVWYNPAGAGTFKIRHNATWRELEGTVPSSVTSAIASLPTVIAGNYTKRLSNYGGNLAAAIADLPNGGANGGEIQVDTEVTITSGSSIPSNIHMIGRGVGVSHLKMSTGVNWPALYVLNASNVLIADMSVSMASGLGTQASQIGMQVSGTCDNVIAERLRIDGMYAGIRARGAAVGSLTGLVLRDMTVINTNKTYGVEVSSADSFLIDNMRVDGSKQDDGLKIGQTTTGGKVLGGHFTNNAQEGIDAFTGGQDLTIIGATCNDNTGGGIIVKTDNITAGDPENLAPRNVQLSDLTCKRNGTSGLGLYKMNSGGSPPTLDDQIAMSQVTINGGEFSDNYADGIALSARNITINGPLVRRNGRHGIYAADESLYVTISNPVSVGNGRNKHFQNGQFTFFGNKAANLWVRGNHVALRGGTLLGVDSDTVKVESDLAGLTKVSTYNVFVSSQANDVYIDPDFEGLSREGLGMQTDKTSGVVQFHYRSMGRSYPTIAGVHGSIGSTYERTDAGANQGIRFTKTSGAPNAYAGWQLEGDPQTVTTLPPAGKSSVGWMMRKDNGSAGDTLHICIKTGASSYAWRQVTLT